MGTETEVRSTPLPPRVEIYAKQSHTSAAASGESESRLSPEHISALQQTLTSLVTGFRPPEVREDNEALHLESLEVELGFKVDTGSGSVLKLIFDASAEASIVAKVVWSRSK